MKDWWLGREQRERQLILLAIVLTFVVGFVQFALFPALDAHQRAKSDFERMALTKADVQSGLNSLQSAERDVAEAEVNTSGLEALISSSAQSGGLQIVRLQPDGAERLNVWLEEVDPRLVFQWVASLERSGITVSKASVQRRDESGSVRANIEFSRVGS